MLKEQIEQDLVKALKERNSVSVAALRLLKSRIQQLQIEKGDDLSDEDVKGLIKSQIKRHKESAESYKTGGRSEQEQEELAQAGVLSAYLPAQMSETEIREKIVAILAQNTWTGKDFGMAMKTVKQELGANADGSLVAGVLKELLQ